MKKLLTLVLLSFFTINSFLAQTTSDPLGIANTFNGFILGDLNHPGGDSEGALAVGGTAVFPTAFTIADRLPSGGNSLGYGFVANGDVTWNGGTIQHGDVHIAGTITGDVNSSILDGTLYNPSTPIDFSAQETYLKSLSDHWKNLTPNGTIDLQAWGGLTLTGTDSDLNVFSLTEAQFKGTGQVVVVVPAGSTVIINVAGLSDASSDHPFWGNMSFNGSVQGSAWTNAIWNFYEMTTF